MKRLAIKGAGLALLNVCLGLAFLHVHESRLAYEPWETDSVLLTMPRGEQVDLAILGSSRAHVLSRYKDNRETLERELGMRTVNMALPLGGGIRPARYYLECFFEGGSTTPRLLYVLDPFVFFLAGPNDSHKFVYAEPLRFSFLKKLVFDGYPVKRILTYVRSKFSHAWLAQVAKPLDRFERTAEYAINDQRLFDGRINNLYSDGLQEDNFIRYRAQFIKILELCRERNVSMFVVLPPTLLGPEPGAVQVLGWLDSLKSEYDFELHDMTSVMAEPEHYYNLDHLNTAGVEFFVREFLAPILANGGGEAGR